MDFKTVKLEDRDWIYDLVSKSGELGCEYCFGNIIMYSGLYKTEIGRSGSFLISYEENRYPSYLYPVGTGDDAEFAALVEALRDHSRSRGRRFRMHRVSEQGKERLERLFPGRFDFVAETDDFDYIYSREALSELTGNKYHSKRNFDARFYTQNPGAVYEEITPANLPECLEMTKVWMMGKEDADAEAETEIKALGLGFENYQQLHYYGGLLRVDGKIAAYTFGEAINDRCFVTHAEKALPGYEGAYAAINRAFARRLAGYELINREEDMGREGLRQAKQSYHPVILYTKYRMVEKIQKALEAEAR